MALGLTQSCERFLLKKYIFCKKLKAIKNYPILADTKKKPTSDHICGKNLFKEAERYEQEAYSTPLKL
eukprot:Seg1405.3 transcript_id=Seg1405.3/GoldUCD/mRNA.D3Y31 product="hypothetical protein" protein_id=Seg1405.3/GoldUCD/D3Y31